MSEQGGCYCGAIRYEISGEQEAAFQCHCRECQYITGGNANIVVVFAENDFKYTRGHPSTFSRPDLENPVERHFCQDCILLRKFDEANLCYRGSRIYW